MWTISASRRQVKAWMLLTFACIAPFAGVHASTEVEVSVPIESHLLANTLTPVFFGDYHSNRAPVSATIPRIKEASWQLERSDGQFWNDVAGVFQATAFNNANLTCVRVLGNVVEACKDSHHSEGVWRTPPVDLSSFPDGAYVFRIKMVFKYQVGKETAENAVSFIVDSDRPQTWIDTPESGNPLFTTASLVLTGGASDNRDIRDVSIEIKDRINGRWWNDDSGSFSFTQTSRRIVAPSGQWSYTFDGGSQGSGRYKVIARARDRAGLEDSTASVRTFRVDEGTVNTTITAPQANAVFLPRPVRIYGGRSYSGSNVGSLGVVNVRVRDTATNQYWAQSANAWVAWPVDNPGRRTKTNDWEYVFDDRSAPGTGPFVVTAQALGGAGVVDATPAETSFAALSWPPEVRFEGTVADYSFADVSTVETIAVPTPTAAEPGDLLIMLAGASFEDPVLTPADPAWIQIVQENPPLGGSGTVAAWWKPADGVPTDVLVSHPDGVPRRVSVLVLRLSGAWDRDLPIAHAAVAGIGSSQPGGPMLEVARDRSLLLSFVYGPNAAFGETFTFHPTGFQNIHTGNFNNGSTPAWFASGYAVSNAATVQPAWGGSGSGFGTVKSVLSIVVQPYEE